MRKNPDKSVLKEIDGLFDKAKSNSTSSLSKKHVASARKLAKRNNISLKKYRRLFCHNCNSYFNGKNNMVRIAKNKKSVKCLECGKNMRFRIS